ncbi:MAG: DUF1194 domain-containing protein, partial [Beijerinckiaceae bacterium]|nr:DUF1194 domain-containing protein [Beijerinckiaceae bacterium]
MVLPARRFPRSGALQLVRQVAPRLLALPFLLAFLLAVALGAPAVAKGGPVEVDVELVLAVDVSYSMDPEEQRLQREGYINAIRSPEFLKAIAS